MKNLPPIAAICLVASLIGCATPDKPPLASADFSQQPAAADKVKKAATIELTSDLVYDILTSEIAAQRGAHKTAFQHAMRAAKQSKAPAMAERATHIALQTKQSTQALQSTLFWIELAPDSLSAHQFATLLYAQKQQPSETLHHLREVTRIANQDNQNGYLRAAAVAEKVGTPEQSLVLMQQVVPADTRNPDALHALALTAMRAKQHALAEQSINRALETRPDWPTGILLLSRSLILQGKKSEGLEVLNQAVEKAPDNNEMRLNYARKLIETQQLNDALKQFEILNEKTPDNADIIYALGVLSTELEQYTEAEGYLLSLLELGEKQGEAHYHLGLIAEEMNDPVSAFEHYLQVDGANQQAARIQMARILAKRNKLNEAREILQQLRIHSDHNGPKLYLIEAGLLREARQYNIAHETYNHGLEKYANNPDLLYSRALNAADMGRVDILERDLNQILATHPNHADALNALGYTLADQTDRLEEARDYIQKALSLKPDNPAILDSMGWVAYRMGQLEEALKYLRQAAAINPDAEIASHLGEVLWHMNRKNQARKVWREAMEREPENRFIKPVMQRLGAE